MVVKNISYMIDFILSAHAAVVTICLCIIVAIAFCPLSGDIWRNRRSCGVRMMSWFCGCPFFALLGAVLHTVLVRLLSVLCPASWLSLLVGLLWPMVDVVSTVGFGGDLATGMLFWGGELTAVKAQLFC